MSHWPPSILQGPTHFPPRHCPGLRPLGMLVHSLICWPSGFVQGLQFQLAWVIAPINTFGSPSAIEWKTWPAPCLGWKHCWWVGSREFSMQHVKIYIFSFLKLPPPPRAAICYEYVYAHIHRVVLNANMPHDCPFFFGCPEYYNSEIWTLASV